MHTYFPSRLPEQQASVQVELRPHISELVIVSLAYESGKLYFVSHWCCSARWV